MADEENDPEVWLDRYGDLLYGYAWNRLKDRQLAEDVVQDTLLSAWKAFDSFEGRSSVKTWLMRILKNRIIDVVRKAERTPLSFSAEDLEVEVAGEYNEAGGINHLYGARHWNMSPEQFSQRSDFWKVLQACAGNLPNAVAEVFLARELDGMSTEEICEDQGITPNHLWVILHRARKGMRKCLEVHWFEKGDDS